MVGWVDLRLKVCWFETHWRHCGVSISKTFYPLLSTGSMDIINLHKRSLTICYGKVLKFISCLPKKGLDKQRRPGLPCLLF